MVVRCTYQYMYMHVHVYITLMEMMQGVRMYPLQPQARYPDMVPSILTFLLPLTSSLLPSPLPISPLPPPLPSFPVHMHIRPPETQPRDGGLDRTLTGRHSYICI